MSAAVKDPVDLKCLKCSAVVVIDTTHDTVTCKACGSVMEVVTDSWWDGEDDHPMLYLEWPENSP